MILWYFFQIKTILQTELQASYSRFPFVDEFVKFDEKWLDEWWVEKFTFSLFCR